MLCFCLGTRPEIIKLAPLIRRAADQEVPFTLVHTGQHYDELLDRVFFRELDLPAPDHNLAAAAPTHGQMLAKMLPAMEALWQKERPSVVIAEGDTNSVLAAAFMAQRLGVPFAHVEAGLRSDDWSMPEEVNRVIADRLADRLYVPTDAQRERLLAEGIRDDRILITGNTVADAVREHLVLSKNVEMPGTFGDLSKRYALITLHRPALVDEPVRLLATLEIIDQALNAEGVRGIFLVHPRTRKHLPAESMLPNIAYHDPVGYLPMLRLLSGAAIAITDSGGVQEEAALLHIPCVTVRENTERPETIRAGGNILAGFDAVAIGKGIARSLKEAIDWKPLYTVEHPADMIMSDLTSRYL